MTPLLVLVFFPVLIGAVSTVLFSAPRSASLAATLGAPVVVYLSFTALDPDGTWAWLATLLVSPLVMSLSLVTVLLWLGRSRVGKRSRWNGA